MPRDTFHLHSEDAPEYRVRPAAPSERAREELVIGEALMILDARLRARSGEMMGTPDDVGRYFKARLAAHPREHFAVMLLDCKHRMIACEDLFAGTIDTSEVHPREVAKFALQHNAAAVIVAHNHPSGSTEPSAQDRAVTARLRDALKLVDVRLLDHFVVGEGEPLSLAMRGWI